MDQIRYLTGYAGGIEKKEKLLEIEGISLTL
ncbi:MAG: MGMT family protein [Holdemanella biformis]|nr:MGMT family protein [Holdemanella biformis]